MKYWKLSLSQGKMKANELTKIMEHWDQICFSNQHNKGMELINYQTKGCSLQECNSSNKHGDLLKKQEILSTKTGIA